MYQDTPWRCCRLGLHSVREFNFNFAFARAKGFMVQVMDLDLGLLILIEGICGLPSLDQEVDGTFVLVHEYAVRVRG